MNSIKNLILLFALISLIFTGCKKYEEGPAFSIRTKTERVANTWKLISYTLNGTDYTSSLNSINYTETYDKDGNYSYNSSIGTGTGRWEFQSDKEQIKRSGVSSQSTETLFILKLKENAFWYYYMDGNDRHEFHFEAN